MQGKSHEDAMYLVDTAESVTLNLQIQRYRNHFNNCHEIVFLVKVQVPLNDFFRFVKILQDLFFMLYGD